MKKKLLISLTALLLIFSSLACSITIPRVVVSSREVQGSGEIVQEQRSIQGVTAVRVANQGDLYIELGDDEKLVVEAEDNLIDLLESDVRRGELILKTKEGVDIRKTKPIRYFLTVKALDEISVSSSGDIEAPEFSTDTFTINVSSSGDVNVDGLNVDELTVRISSSGDVVVDVLDADQLNVDISSSGSLKILEGKVMDQEISLSSSGEYIARYVESNQADVLISSSGDATIQVSDQLNVKISSSGDVYYYGEPSTKIKLTSSGDVIHMDG